MMLLGKEYRISCTPESRDELLATVAFLDDRFREIGCPHRLLRRKLAVMTALNIAHEFLLHQRGNGFDMPGMKRRIGLMKARLDGVLGNRKSFS